MHYKNGREAKEGDQIVGIDANGKAVGGTLVNIRDLSGKCNGNVLPPSVIWGAPLVILKKCLHIDDMTCDAPEVHSAPEVGRETGG